LRIGGAHGADHHFERRLDLGLIGAFGPELAGGEHGLQHFSQIAVAFKKGFGHAVDQRRRRIVRHKTLRQAQ
jgi:hypothetical protein